MWAGEPLECGPTGRVHVSVARAGKSEKECGHERRARLAANPLYKYAALDTNGTPLAAGRPPATAGRPPGAASARSLFISSHQERSALKRYAALNGVVDNRPIRKVQGGAPLMNLVV